MSVINANAPITMICDDLNRIPQFETPDGFAFRWFQPGDEKVWREIQSKADQYNEITADLFAGQFGADMNQLRERQGYLLNASNEAVATATAWFDEDYEGEEYGRIHWVAVIPEMQGQGLSKPLMSRVCNRLKRLGHQQAYLTTSAARIAAINLYLKFGFKVAIRGDQDEEVWEAIRKEIEKYEEGK
jgi:GNAT superfamily N-acetyltransferase